MYPFVSCNCRSGASLLSSTDCASPKQRRWPEDIAWHPEGNSLFSVYSADSGDSQVSVLNLNRTQGVRAAFEINCCNCVWVTLRLEQHFLCSWVHKYRTGIYRSAVPLLDNFTSDSCLFVH